MLWSLLSMWTVLTSVSVVTAVLEVEMIHCCPISSVTGSTLGLTGELTDGRLQHCHSWWTAAAGSHKREESRHPARSDPAPPHSTPLFYRDFPPPWLEWRGERREKQVFQAQVLSPGLPPPLTKTNRPRHTAQPHSIIITPHHTTPHHTYNSQDYIMIYLTQIYEDSGGLFISHYSTSWWCLCSHLASIFSL